MSAGRLERVRELFDRACDLAPGARDAFLNEQCAGDSELRARVDRLLRQTERASSPIDVSPVGEQIRSALGSMEARPLPERVGRFRVLCLIGRGGMGAVYEAEQDNPRRSVALKVVRSDAASPDVLRRFEHEAQILGRLQHPGIACIHEAGIADIGSGPQPYLAMELIRGSGLRAHLAAGTLDLRAKLDLFVRICEAVEHAHRAGVVHRDLKPSNILINEAGQPKIVDFGVARVTTPGSAGATMHTRTGQIMGTLTYMSPEQIAGDGASVDGRSDVYALGVILFETLTGRLPHDFESRSLAEAARMIREEEPSRLSSINSSLKGDLETIVAKALEKEPTRRYSSAGDLAADVRRFLRDEPIRARPASTVYQLQKFARRHREIVAGIGAVFVVLVLGLVTVSWFAMRETRQRRLAESNEARAEWSSYRNCIAAADRSLQLNDSARAIVMLETAPAALRGWEWRYLRHSADQSRLTISCDGPVSSLAISGDGEFVIAAGEDGFIRRWNAVDGSLIGSFRAHAGAIKSIALSPDGASLISSGSDGTVKGWRFDAAEPLWTIERSPPVHPRAFSPDGKTFVLALEGEIRLVDARTGREIESLATCPPVASMVAQSSDGALLVYQLVDTVVCVDRKTRADLWRRLSSSFSVGAGSGTSSGVWVYSELGFFATKLDARTGESVKRIDEVLGVSESADGRRVAMPDRSGSIVVRDGTTLNIVTTLRGHSGPVHGTAFSSDGAVLATSAGAPGGKAEIKLWAVSEAGGSFVILGSNDAVVSGAILPSGTRAVTGGWSGVKSWDLASGRELWTSFPALREYHTIAFSPDGKRIAAGGYDGALLILDAADGRLVAKSKPIGAAIGGCAWRADGKSVVAACWDSVVREFDAATGETRAEQKFGSLPLGGITSALGGDLAVSNAESVWVVPWQSAGASSLEQTNWLPGPLPGFAPEVRTERGNEGRSARLAWNKAGTQLAIGTEAGAVVLWDLASRREVWARRDIKGDVRAIAFSGAGDRIIAGCADASLHVIDTKTGDDLLTLKTPRSDICAVSFCGEDSSAGAVFSAEPGGIVLFETRDSAADADARRGALAARTLVDERFAKQVFAADVIAGIRADTSLSPGIRDAALSLAAARGDHPNYLNSQAWAVVRYAGAPKDEIALALRKSRRACEMRPEHASFLNTLGVSLLRAGELQEALSVLMRSIDIRKEAGAELHPLDLLSLAIVEAKLGEREKAKEDFAAGERLMKGTGFEKDPECVSFLGEARGVVGE